MGPRSERSERLPEKPVSRLSDEKNEHMCMFPLFLSIFFTSTNVVIENHILVNQSRMCVCVCVWDWRQVYKTRVNEIEGKKKTNPEVGSSNKACGRSCSQKSFFFFFAGTIMMKKRHEGPTSGSLVWTVILRFRRNLRVDYTKKA